jgi:hypothetical protein
MRKAIPALQKGTWRWDGSNSGNAVGFVRKFGNSECAVGLAKDGAASFNFSSLTNGVYKDAVTGNTITVSNGSLSFTVSSSSAGVYVLNGPGIIGALGEGFFQSTSNGNGGTSGGVTFSPLNPIAGQSLTVTYNGTLVSNSQIVMHYSFDNWTVGGINNINMTKQGNVWVATVAVPLAAKINFSAAFNNGNGTWDNNNSQDYKTSLAQPDLISPTIVSSLPVNNSTSVINQPILKLNFTESIKLGTGFISIYENNSLKTTIDVSNHQGKILVNGNSIEILGQSFDNAAQVYVLIPTTCILDLSGNSFAGFTNAQQWKFTIGSASSLDELEKSSWLVFPNPASELVFVRNRDVNKRIKNLRIFDITGAEIRITPYGNEEVLSLDLSGLAQGIYILEIENFDGKIFRKELLH